MEIRNKLKAFGPGLLFAGAAIGVSHLVQSTRAGADFGFGLLWALIIVHFIKYPFFQFGTRYTQATNKNLLEGYYKLNPLFIVAYFIINFASMFTIQAAVTTVTTGLALNILRADINPTIVSAIITIVCAAILLLGQYKLLDKVIKIVIIALTLTTVGALIIAIFKNDTPVTWQQKFIFEGSEIAFLIAFLGWMPAPLDVSIWQSLWSQQKQQNSTKKRNLKTALLDFNVGYVTTLILGICFLSMGAIVMYSNGENFPTNAIGFCEKLVNMYTLNIGDTAFVFIAIAAFTTMFSTNITALDASPRGMQYACKLLKARQTKFSYALWILILTVGTLTILIFFKNHMLALIKIATILSFLTAPFFAILNYKLITSKHTPIEAQPGIGLKILSYIGIIFLIGFSLWYLASLFNW